MRKLLGIEITDEYYDYLFREQSNGKELKVINNNVVAVEHEITDEELKQKRLLELENWFNNYFEKQLIQSSWQNDFKISYDKYFNLSYESIEQLKTKAEEVRNEINNLRIL